MHTLFYTLVDESPALATYSLLPILKAFMRDTGIQIKESDISLSGRLLAAFGLAPDHLSDLGKLTESHLANIIKLPNISASLSQLKEAISELQSQGFALPNYPEKAQTPEDQAILARYAKVLGSAVNPVLREGNSDRRAPNAVKNYAKKHPHTMGPWSASSRTHVSHMESGDFYHNERSVTVDVARKVRIEFLDASGESTILKPYFALLAGEIIDTTFMCVRELDTFLEKELADAKSRSLLFSLHLKATMMKISDPIIFGHAVRVYFKSLFSNYQPVFEELGIDANAGLHDLEIKIKRLPEKQKTEILEALQSCYQNRPSLAMVNSDQGITNLHIPSDIIVDASMPAMIRSSGKMWNSAGQLQDTKAVIPDKTYAEIYQVVIDDCKKNGAYNPATMGSVSNLGLMAQKAEEYGSHDKTFEASGDGIIRVIDETGHVLLENNVEKGDIWRMCQVKDTPIQEWVKLAVQRAKLTQTPTVFWLDPHRAHDQELIKKVTQSLSQLDTSGTDIRTLSLVEATQFSLSRIRQGLDTISVTGNVLRDYNTDLFPILELGTSAKMLSIVPLMKGGGLFETGAGGSAPKLFEQFLEEGHLRWDSLGEFLALSASLSYMYTVTHHVKAKIFAETLDQAIELFLDEDKSPQPHVGQRDIRGSHFYLALYWAQMLARQSEDGVLSERFSLVAEALKKNEVLILEELISPQGQKVNLGGYYHPNPDSVSKQMRPSTTFNNIIEG